MFDVEAYMAQRRPVEIWGEHYTTYVAYFDIWATPTVVRKKDTGEYLYIIGLTIGMPDDVAYAVTQAKARHGLPPYLNGRIPTERQSYTDGFKTGLCWKDSYRPGGPHVSARMGFRHAQNAEWIAYCQQTKVNHDAWMRGFDEGRAAQEGELAA